MPIKYTERVVYCQGVCDSDEAEPLLQWLQQHPKGKVNLKNCEHLHTAVLQVLFMIHPVITAKPSDKQLNACLLSLWAVCAS